MMDNLGDRFSSWVSGFNWGAKIIDADDFVSYISGEVVGSILNILMLKVIQGDKDKIHGLCWDIMLWVLGGRNMQ